jgi:DNA-binding response OmpR family regulator
MIKSNNSLRGQNIMIVNDEDDINLLFEMLLSGEGYNVKVFTNPHIAINNFERDLYDLLIIDILLPDLNGFELYERLRSLDIKVKVCFLTAGEINYEQFKKAASFPEITTEDCFIKIPVENSVLKRKVKNILSIQLNYLQSQEKGFTTA